MRKAQSVRLLLFFATFCMVVAGTHANAASANVSTSYKSSDSLTNGSLVSLDPTRSDYVQAANTSNGQRLIGVVVASNDSLIALDPTNGSVQVATTGSALALASTLNGSIAIGDQIGVSPFAGVGMKAEADSYVVGIAQTALNNTTAGTQVDTVTDLSGHKIPITVGYVRVTLGIHSSVGTATKRGALQEFVKGLTGHYVSTPRLVVSIGISGLALLVLSLLTYSSIYGSIVSIGRNPLAKFAVFRTLTSVLAVTACIALLAGGTIYLLLR